MPRKSRHNMKQQRIGNKTKNAKKKEKQEAVEQVPHYYYTINPDRRVTRQISKILQAINNFSLIEVYRCMPLLGDEYNIPYWDVHAVRYSVVFGH
ncbi:unnamed protein product [Colias eurytheme]|nr:unnamed protein product [Colias eurytheme]